MKYILGAICGFLALNIIVLLIMVGATFITWESHFIYIDEWTEALRGNYFMFGLIFIATGVLSNIKTGDSKSKPKTFNGAYSDTEFGEKNAALDKKINENFKKIHEAEIRLGINKGVNK